MLRIVPRYNHKYKYYRKILLILSQGIYLIKPILYQLLDILKGR